eukprot:9904020-Alexandrium_andersonii.AAC.1
MARRRPKRACRSASGTCKFLVGATAHGGSALGGGDRAPDLGGSWQTSGLARKRSRGAVRRRLARHHGGSGLREGSGH